MEPRLPLTSRKDIEMKTSKIIAAAALSILAAAAAQAETYEGVQAPVSANSRAEVNAQAVVAARSENPYADGVSSRVAPALTASADRAAIRSQAVATAHEPNQNLDRKAFVNSVVPSQYKISRPVTQQAGL
jgi:hypothetical protein